MWTRFMDMNSGGSPKLSSTLFYIEAPEDEAVRIFEEKYGRDPHHITCACCGPDYSVWEDPDVAAEELAGAEVIYADTPATAEEIHGPVADLLEESGFDALAKWLKEKFPKKELTPPRSEA